MKVLCLILAALLLCLTACTAVDTPAESTPAPKVTPLPSETALPADTDDPEPAPSVEPGSSWPPVSLETFLSGAILGEDVAPFSKGDMALGAVTIDSTPDDIKRILGQPDEESVNDQYAIGEALTYSYPSAEAVFILDGEDCYFLHYFSLKEGDMLTPRGIGIGSPVEDVIRAYADRTETVSDDQAIFYRYNTGSDSMDAIPPRGNLWAGDDQWTISFSIPRNIAEYDAYSREDLEGGAYVYCWHYSLNFDIRSGKVAAINLLIGPFGE